MAHSIRTVTIARAMMGRWKKEGNHFPPNSKLVQEPEGNEEITYPDADSNKTKINYAKEPNEAHKNNLKEKILQLINENLIEMILDMVNQNVQETFKKFQDNKNREFEKAQEQIKESIEKLYKHQSETKSTVNKEINELRMKIDNIKRKGLRIWKASEKRMKQKCKTKWKANPAE
jgi:molecular chaperone DnaK (HSP70)